MDLEDLTEPVKKKLNSPIYFSIFLVFLSLNWKAIFLLLMTDAMPWRRIELFEQSTSFWSLLFWPILGGFAIAALSPYVRWGFSMITGQGIIGRIAEENKTAIAGERDRVQRENEIAQLRLELAEKTKKAADQISEIEDKKIRDEVIDSFESQTGMEWLRQHSSRSMEEVNDHATFEKKLILYIIYNKDTDRMKSIANKVFEDKKLRKLLLSRFIIFFAGDRPLKLASLVDKAASNYKGILKFPIFLATDQDHKTLELGMLDRDTDLNNAIGYLFDKSI